MIGADVKVADSATLPPGSADGTPGTPAPATSVYPAARPSTIFGKANVAAGALNVLNTVKGPVVTVATSRAMAWA